MKRPSFQFYPADWRNNAKLRRCSWEARGAWLEVMCLLHDSEEYGVLRWPLKEIAQAIGAPIRLLRELADKGVMRGGDDTHDGLIYTPRSGRKDGEPVSLVDPGAGPCWMSSRMVVDEYVREKRGNSDLHNHSPNKSPKVSPNPPIGDLKSDLPTSTSTSTRNTNTPLPPKGGGRRFEEFWLAWPKGERKQDKVKCAEKWRRAALDEFADVILADIRKKRGTEKWREGFIEAPLVYLNGRRWEDDNADPAAISGRRKPNGNPTTLELMEGAL